MSKILDKYSFNVAPKKTSMHWIKADKGGLCPRPCTNCNAYNQQCTGCNFIECLDRECKGTECKRCPFLCGRGGGRLTGVIDFINGLEVDLKYSNDEIFRYDVNYIPAYNKRLPKSFDYDFVSIPFYAIYDFETGQMICSDIKDYFRIPEKTVVFINFYMKDDKISAIFDLMTEHLFIPLLKAYKGVTFWHTPCFSVFVESSNMDRVLNFKRQFWSGDIMRDAGFNVFQEILYTENSKNIKTNLSEACEIMVKKGLKKIAQCRQLDKTPFVTLQHTLKFIKKMPKDSVFLLTGLPNKMQDAYRNLSNKIIFSNYAAGYSQKGNKAYSEIRNNDLKRG